MLTRRLVFCGHFDQFNVTVYTVSLSSAIWLHLCTYAALHGHSDSAETSHFKIDSTSGKSRESEYLFQ